MMSRYRSDIDGLRAVAVLAVVGFHAFPTSIPGGFIGVDVFFVISGYLISGIIFDDVALGRFTYAGFYARRIRRIFPTLITVLLATLGAGFFLGVHTEVVALGRHIAAGAGFVSNFLLWHETGYFDTAAETKPLLHLWSLGVEEQFYIFWPLMIAMLSKRAVPLVIALVMAASFVANIAWMDFYSPLTRFWELMCGALLAYSRPKLHPIIGLFGAMLIVGTTFLFNERTPFPGWAALLPTIGAMSVIASPAGLISRALSTRAAVGIGLISYPLYLWHWPILSWLRIAMGHDVGILPRFAAVLAAFVLAWATYRWIEKPVRFGNALRVRTLTIGLASIGAVGLLLPAALPESARDRFAAHFENAAPEFRYGSANDFFRKGREECNFLDIRTNQPREAIDPSCTQGSDVLLWGDSHIQHLGYSLGPFMQIATSGCIPGAPSENIACRRSNSFALAEIERIKPRLIVIAQRTRHEATDWDALAADLKRRGVGSIVLLGPVPQWAMPLPMLVVRHHWPQPARLKDGLLKAPFDADTSLRKLRSVRYVSMVEGLCNADGCLVSLGPEPDDLMMYDYGHFTPAGSRFAAERIVTPAIEAALRATAAQPFHLEPRH